MSLKVLGFAGSIAKAFIKSKLTPLVVIASIFLGVFAIIVTPREEEPQIVVPMIDVLVNYPGASAKEVDELVTKPMSKFLWEIKGVEYIYTLSQTRDEPGYCPVLCGSGPGKKPGRPVHQAHVQL